MEIFVTILEIPEHSIYYIKLCNLAHDLNPMYWLTRRVSCFVFYFAGCTTGCARTRTGATDCLYVGSCTTTGTEADVGRTSLPTHPEHVPRPRRKDHRHVAGNRQLRVVAHA